MNSLAKIATAAFLMGGAAFMTAAPANAGLSVSVGIGVPGFVRGYPAYYGYDYYRPCEFYLNNDLPAPRRCYSYFYNVWGPGLYFDGNFIFRDRAHWWRWHDRDDYRRWYAHDFGYRGHDGGDRGWDHGRGGWWDHGGGRDGWDRGGDHHDGGRHDDHDRHDDHHDDHHDDYHH